MHSPLPRLSFPRMVLSPLGAVLVAALVTTAPARASLVVEATPASPAQDDAAARDAFRSTVFLPTVAGALTPVSGEVVFAASDPHVRTSTAVACVQMLSACTRVLLPAPCVAWNPQNDPQLDPELVAFLTGDADAAIEQEAIDAALQELDARSEGFWGLTAEICASGDDAGLPRKNAWNARGRASDRAAIAAAQSARSGGGGGGGGGGAGGRGPRGFRTAQTAASVENGSVNEPAGLGATSPQTGGTTGSGGSGLAGLGSGLPDLGVVPPATDGTNPGGSVFDPGGSVFDPGGSVFDPGGSFSSSSSYTPPSASNTGTGSVSVNPEPVSAGVWALLAAAAACGARGRRCLAA